LRPHQSLIFPPGHLSSVSLGWSIVVILLFEQQFTGQIYTSGENVFQSFFTAPSSLEVLAAAQIAIARAVRRCYPAQ